MLSRLPAHLRPHGPVRKTSRIALGLQAAAMSKIQLYSLDTPNGQKVGVALEELGLPYEAHVINIRTGLCKAALNGLNGPFALNVGVHS